MAEKKNSKNTSAKKTTSTTVKKTSSKTTPKKETVKVSKKEVEKVIPVKEKKEEVKIVSSKNEKKPTFAEIVKENLTLIFLCVICLLLIINIILIALGHKVKLSDGKEIVASIDNKNITADELYDSIKEKYGTNELVNMIDNTIIEREITDTKGAEEKAKEQVSSLSNQYTQMGYKWSDVLSKYGYASEDELVSEIKTSILKEEVVKKYLAKNITDEEIQKYYDENVEDTYTAKHILITPNTSDSMSDEEKAAAEETAKNTANEVITKLNNGEDWSSLVSSYSTDSGSKDKDGLIENFTKGDVVDEFFNAVKELSDGSYTSEPVKSKYGYHVILRVSKTDKEALENMKTDLTNEIIKSKLSSDSNLYTTTWDSIRKEYNLKINDTTIENAYNKTIKA